MAGMKADADAKTGDSGGGAVGAGRGGGGSGGGGRGDVAGADGGGDGSFREQRLVEKLNSSAASIHRIWDEPKVFGTRIIESLKDDILGDNPPSSNPSSNSKVAWKDSGTIVKKLTGCGMLEKIVTAYQSVVHRHFDEDIALNKCKSNVGVLERINKDIVDASTNGNQPASTLISNLQAQKMTLKQCIEQLESVDVARISLIDQLKEVLNEQESKSVVLRGQLQVARAEAERAIQLRQQLCGSLATSGTQSSSSPLMITPPGKTAAMTQGSGVRSAPPQSQPLNPATSLPPTVSAVGDESKRTAAAIADKLASMPAPVLTSIFSSLAAEQAASMNGGSPSGGPPGFQIEKRPRLEKTTQAADMGAPPFFGQAPQVQVQQQIGEVPSSLGGMQPPTLGPFPPPMPSLFPLLLQQSGQNTGGMIGMGGPFGLMAGSMPPPPPFPNILSAGFPRSNGPSPPPLLPMAQSQPQQWQSPQEPQQSPTSTGFFQSSGMGFFPPSGMGFFPLV